MAKKGNRLGGAKVASNHSSILPYVEDFLRDALKVPDVVVNTGRIKPKASGERRIKINNPREGTIVMKYTCAGCQECRVTGPPDRLDEVVTAWQNRAAKQKVQFKDGRTTDVVA